MSVNGDGSLDTRFSGFGTDAEGAAFALDLSAAAHAHGVKAMLMLGGAGLSDGVKPAMADLDGFVARLLDTMDTPTIRTLLDRSGFDVLRIERHVLLGQTPWVRRLSKRLATIGSAKRSTKSTSTSSVEAFEMPSAPPRGTLLDALGASVETFVRYRVGALGPQAGQRCSLTVIARLRDSVARSAATGTIESVPPPAMSLSVLPQARPARP